MAEFKQCLSCTGPCCITPLSLSNNERNYGEVRLSDVEQDVENFAVLIEDRIKSFKAGMGNAEVAVRGIFLDIYNDTPGLLEIFWNIQFSCLSQNSRGKCDIFDYRPQVCKSYACASVCPDDARITKEDLAKRAKELRRIDWKALPKDPTEICAKILELIDNS